MINYVAKFVEDNRKEQGLSINALSKKSGVPYSTLAQIEKGKCIPQIVTYDKILNALGYELVLMKTQALDDILKNIKTD